MSNRTLLLYSLLITGCIAILFLAKFLPAVWTVSKEPYATHNGVKGAAVEQDKKLWTLNFEQQNSLIDALNKGEPIGLELIKKDSSLFPYTKIILYQFNKPDLVLVPINFVHGDIAFQENQLVKNGYLLAGEGDRLAKLLLETYDP